jgi:preprotein translocase subunit Sec61beta
MAGSDDPGPPVKPARNAGFLPTLRAVLWSFFGVRRRSEYEKDAVHLNPVYVIVAGIGAAAVFVLVLLMVVRMVVSG